MDLLIIWVAKEDSNFLQHHLIHSFYDFLVGIYGRLTHY